jgi:hypothetical protein
MRGILIAAATLQAATAEAHEYGLTWPRWGYLHHPDEQTRGLRDHPVIIAWASWHQAPPGWYQDELNAAIAMGRLRTVHTPQEVTAWLRAETTQPG